MQKRSPILVTGANGLVGTALVSQLAAEGFTNVMPMTRLDCDLMNPQRVRDLFKHYRPEYVFHTAARVYGILGNMHKQGESYYENTMINTNVVDACIKGGVRKITAIGTGAVYPANPKSLPMREDEIFEGRPHPSESGYAHAKRGMLAMLEAYAESYGLDWAYVVSCNLFGPHDRFQPVTGHVVPSLISKFSKALDDGGLVHVWGDGSAQRDFLYVKDAARAITTIMRGPTGAVNMGGGTVWSIREIVEMLSAISGVDRIIWDPTKPNGQDYRAYDLSRLTAAGFTREYMIDEGLQETWEWYRGKGNLSHR